MSTTVFVSKAHALAKVGDDYYSCSLSGMRQLCRAHPELCRPPEVQARLARLGTHRTVAYVLYGAAGASFVGGMALGIKTGLSSYGERGGGYIYAGMGVAGAMALAALILMPYEGDYEKFVDRANAASGQEPIRWHLGAAADGPAAGLALNVAF